MATRSIFDPLVPAGAYDEFAATAAPASAAQRAWTSADGPLPALYIGHGAPPLLDDAEWMAQLASWTHTLPKPRGVLIVSAHWEAAPLMLSAPGAATPLVYDFGGFQPRYYTLTYPTPDASSLAREVAGLMPAAAPASTSTRAAGSTTGPGCRSRSCTRSRTCPCCSCRSRRRTRLCCCRLAHGCGRCARPGCSIIGSGFLTHGLPFLTREMVFGSAVPGWSSDFDLWASDALERGDVEALTRFRQAPGMPYAHPTADHFLPLFVTLGAASDSSAPVETVIDGYWMGLAKRSFQVS